MTTEPPRTSQRVAFALTLAGIVAYVALSTTSRRRFVFDEQLGNLLVLLVGAGAGAFGPERVSRFVGRVPLVIALAVIAWLMFAVAWLADHG